MRLLQAKQLLSTTSARVIMKRLPLVLGIETSCDDTAVAIMSQDRAVLASRRFADRSAQLRLGGICPRVVAEQHRHLLPSLISECLSEARVRPADVHAVAVTNRPGLVIALKTGIDEALRLARLGRTSLIPVDHMRAHALSALLVDPSIQFPFLTLLISGGHSLIVNARSPSCFSILGRSQSGSAGECLDKLGRALAVSALPEFATVHPGAAIEALAARGSPLGHLRYSPRGPSAPRADFDFSQLKASFLTLITKHKSDKDFSIEDMCASVQHHVTRHICSRLHAVMDWCHGVEEMQQIRHVVVSGGVASNGYISDAVGRLAEAHGISLVRIPPWLCTDNAEMIAHVGHLLIEQRSPDIIPYSSIPSSLYAFDRVDIGVNERYRVPNRPTRRLKAESVHNGSRIVFYSKPKSDEKEKEKKQTTAEQSESIAWIDN